MSANVPTTTEFNILSDTVAALKTGLNDLTNQHNLLVAEVLADEKLIAALQVVPPVIPPPVIPPPVPGFGEPVLGSIVPILATTFDSYTAPQNYRESDPWWPWLVPSEPLSAYGVVPGRSGKAIQLTYTAGNPERHLWITHPEVKPGGWYSPGSAAIAVSYGFRIHKNGLPGGSPGYGSTNKGMKWFELWRQDQSDRGQFGPTAGNAQTGPLWHFHPAGSTLLAGFQPVGPYWNQLNDAQWHRVTYLVKPSAVRGDLTGIARMWVDGQKIVDVSVSAINLIPPGGTKVWCTDAEVRSLDTAPIGRLHLGEYMNGVAGDGVTDLPMSLEFDDFAWWVV